MTMFNSLFKKDMPKSNPISTKVTLLLPSETVSNGVLSRSSAFQVVDAAASENQFRSSDFSIGNLLAIGAFNTLKQTCMVNTSRLNSADSFDNFNLSDYVPPQS